MNMAIVLKSATAAYPSRTTAGFGLAPGEAFLREPDGSPMRDEDGNPVPGPVSERWVGSGRTILDNKDHLVKQYEPYFSSTSAYESEAELVEYGVTPIIRYDPMGRPSASNCRMTP